MKSEATLTSSIYIRLRHDLVSGELPPNQPLRMETLRDRYQVGASPIREALNRLYSEGFVDQADRRGFRTLPVRLEELEELTITRCWIGEVAARDAIQHGGDAWEEQAILALHRMEKAGAGERHGALSAEEDIAHKAFHHALLAGCRSRLLLGFWDSLFDKARRYQILSVTGELPKRDVATEHRDLLNAFIKRDVEEAVRLHTSHIELTRDLVLSGLAASGYHAKKERAGRRR